MQVPSRAPGAADIDRAVVLVAAALRLWLTVALLLALGVHLS